MTRTYVSVNELPTIARQALDSLSYNRKDIQVVTAESVVLAGAGGDGRRDFVTMVNLTTSAAETHWGSWGGQNMFNRTNAVDNDETSYPLPMNGLIIKGSIGGGHGTYATIYISDDMVQKVITSGPTETLDKISIEALRIFMHYKAFARPDYFRRAGVTEAHLVDLVARGYLKQNKAGARQITTSGKNAAQAH
jgi:hypothetical protein